MKPQQSEFLDAVRTAPGVTLIEVTVENRNYVLKQLVEGVDYLYRKDR